MKEIVKGIIILIMLFACFCSLAVITINVLTDMAYTRYVEEYSSKDYYPDRFSLPSNAKRFIPFYMPNNVAASMMEYVPPVYDIIQVEGFGKLITGAMVTYNDETETYSVVYNDKEYTNLATSISNIQDDVFPCSKDDFVNFILIHCSNFTDCYVNNPTYGDNIKGAYSGIYTSIYDIGTQGYINVNEDAHAFLSENFDNPWVDFELLVSDRESDDYCYFYVNSNFVVIRGEDDREYETIGYDFTSPGWYSQADYNAEVTPLFEFGGEYSIKFYEGFVWDF